MSLRDNLKEIKRIDYLGSVNFSDLCIHPGLKFPVKFKCLDFGSMKEELSIRPLKIYWVAVAQYRDNHKLLV